MLVTVVTFMRRPNGDLERFHELLDGTCHGPWITYSRDKVMLVRRTIRHGKLHGPYVEYYNDGSLRSECMYVDDVPVGRLVVYHPDGRVRFMKEYD
jgi:antitoxin component YwqK of YwqJK toxin-antitoxin module